nr:MAG TPA: hypothetical protein [Bacteriophage sp.]
MFSLSFSLSSDSLVLRIERSLRCAVYILRYREY